MRRRWKLPTSAIVRCLQGATRAPGQWDDADGTDAEPGESLAANPMARALTSV